jgi:hypothetical protein
VPVSTTRELLVVHLRTYGEEGAAAAIAVADENTLERIFDRADRYLYAEALAKTSGASPVLAEALARAAVEVIEGAPRPLRWKRRKLKGIYPGC